MPAAAVRTNKGRQGSKQLSRPASEYAGNREPQPGNAPDRSGGCEPAYNFTVDIPNGRVTHPNLVRFRGYLQNSGSVRASVAVQDKYAFGSGRLFGSSGKGT